MGAIPVQRPGLAWALYSDALGQTGRLEDALEATGRALRLAPTYLPALLGRSNLARRLAAAAGAESWEAFLETSLDAARKATAQARDRPAPWTALALAADEAGLPELARCAARAAADVARDDPRALFLVAWTSVESAPEQALGGRRAGAGRRTPGRARPLDDARPSPRLPAGHGGIARRLPGGASSRPGQRRRDGERGARRDRRRRRPGAGDPSGKPGGAPSGGPEHPVRDSRRPRCGRDSWNERCANSPALPGPRRNTPRC